MGRVVRRVPPNWKHPEFKHYPTGAMRKQPMFDRDFEKAMADWLSEFDRVRSGNLSDIERECYPRGLADWLQDEGAPPDPRFYRPWDESDATWHQVWENVSEGTPVTPPFETQDELIEYLAANGDFWDQKRCWEDGWETLYRGKYGVSAWGRERAERFVRATYAPSLLIVNGEIMPTGTA